MNRRLALGFAVLLLIVSTLGCVDQTATAESADASAAPAATGDMSTAPVSRIVFVDVEKSCPCTSDRIEKMWALMQTALADRTPAIAVERLHLDTQAAQVQKYRDMETIFAVPAIYLLDAGGKLLKMIQGEATKADLAAAIAG